MTTKCVSIVLFLCTSIAQTQTFQPTTSPTSEPTTVDILVEPEIYNTSNESIAQLFVQFQYNYSRNYSDPSEEAFRFNLFVNNINFLNEHNAKYPDIDYTLGINKFIDWTEDEFSAINGFIAPNDANWTDNSSVPTTRRLADNIPNKDWTDKTYDIEDQGNFNTCWAFAATAAWESRWFIKCHEKHELSEQEIIDCTSNLQDQYGGGKPQWAFVFGTDNKGVSLKGEYREYDGSHNINNCPTVHDPKFHYAPLSGWKYVSPAFDEDAIIAALQDGPIASSVMANDNFQNFTELKFYKDGVFTGDCGVNVTHAIVIVGYGALKRNNKTTKYWKVRNSWSKDWGKDGYIYICRDCGKNGNKGQCGINRWPKYPIPICPTKSPTTDPTESPSTDPTRSPTVDPTRSPTVDPTRSPTVDPTRLPTTYPTRSPTTYPTRLSTTDTAASTTIEIATTITTETTEKTATTATMATAPATTAVTTSPTDYIYEDDGVTRTWYEANTYCHTTYGTELATITKSEQLDFVLDIIYDATGTSPWIGLNSLYGGDGGNFIYLNGVLCPIPFNGKYGQCVYSDWWLYKGRPRCPHNDENGSKCVRLLPDPIGLIDNDIKCDDGSKIGAFLCNAPNQTK